MSENDRIAHQQIRNTGRFKVLNEDQEDTIRTLLAGQNFSLEEDCESTLELPQLRIK